MTLREDSLWTSGQLGQNELARRGKIMKLTKRANSKVRDESICLGFPTEKASGDRAQFGRDGLKQNKTKVMDLWTGHLISRGCDGSARV